MDCKYTFPQNPQVVSALVRLPTDIHYVIFRYLLVFTDLEADIGRRRLERKAYEDYREAFDRYIYGEAVTSAAPRAYKEAVERLSTIRKRSHGVSRTHAETTEHIRDGLHLAVACQTLYAVGSRVFYHENILDIGLEANCKLTYCTALMDNLRWWPTQNLSLDDPGTATVESDLKVHKKSRIPRYLLNPRSMPIDTKVTSSALAIVRKFSRVRFVVFENDVEIEDSVHFIVRLFKSVLYGKHVQIDFECLWGQDPTCHVNVFEYCKMLKCQSLRIDSLDSPEQIQTQLESPIILQDTYGEWLAFQQCLVTKEPQLFFRMIRLNSVCRNRKLNIEQAAQRCNFESFSSGLGSCFHDLLRWACKEPGRTARMNAIVEELRGIVTDSSFVEFCESLQNLTESARKISNPETTTKAELATVHNDEWKEWEIEGCLAYAEDLFLSSDETRSCNRKATDKGGPILWLFRRIMLFAIVCLCLLMTAVLILL